MIGIIHDTWPSCIGRTAMLIILWYPSTKVGCRKTYESVFCELKDDVSFEQVTENRKGEKGTDPYAKITTYHLAYLLPTSIALVIAISFQQKSTDIAERNKYQQDHVT